jgi:hypothetical protein
MRRNKFQYHVLHNTGDEPCTEGPCCLVYRETKRVGRLLDEWRKAVPEEIEERLNQAALTGAPTWPQEVDEILFVLDETDALTLAQVCKMVGVPRRSLMAWRRKYDHLEVACRDFMAAVVEDEMETSRRGMAPSVMSMALERTIPTYAKELDGTLSEEDILIITRTVIESIRNRVAALDIPEDEQAALVQGLSTDLIHAFTMRGA